MEQKTEGTENQACCTTCFPPKITLSSHINLNGCLSEKQTNKKTLTLQQATESSEWQLVSMKPQQYTYGVRKWQSLITFPLLSQDLVGPRTRAFLSIQNTLLSVQMDDQETSKAQSIKREKTQKVGKPDKDNCFAFVNFSLTKFNFIFFQKIKLC